MPPRGPPPPDPGDSSGTHQPTKPPIGAGHLAAMGRLGLEEARAALQALPDSNVVREGPPGLFGKPTQGEVATDRRAEPPGPSEGLDFNEERLTGQEPGPRLGDYVARAKAQSHDLYGRAPTHGHDRDVERNREED